MYKNNTILAIVPARGNSKGIKNKNLKKIKGVSLVEHAGNLLKKITWIDYSIISSDSDKIIKAAKRSELECVFKRPKNISGDRIGDHAVIKHALKTVEKTKKKKFDIILLIQPTSPLRKVKHIKNVIKKIIDEKLDSVWTISKVDLKFHPLKQLVLKKNILSHYSEKGKDIVARQQLSNTYYRNGVVYAVTRKLVLKNKNLIGNKSSGYLINTQQVSIDTLKDLKLANKLI
jgi:CMP-N,N'-diacetyllegionaminic acid synthase